MQGIGTSGAAGNKHFCEDGENALAMSTLVELGWSIQLATTSAELYHSDTHTFVCASLVHGKYYVTPLKAKKQLIQLTEKSENRDHDDEVSPLVEVTYNAAGGHENSLLAASLEVWNT